MKPSPSPDVRPRPRGLGVSAFATSRVVLYLALAGILLDQLMP